MPGLREEVLSLLLETKFPLQRILTDRLDAVIPQGILEIFRRDTILFVQSIGDS